MAVDATRIYQTYRGQHRLSPEECTADGLDAIDWRQTRAYSIGLSGIYLNLAGREGHGTVTADEAPRLASEICQRLTGLADPATGEIGVRVAVRRGQAYHGAYVGEAPDERARSVARAHGIHLNGAAQQFQATDFDRFDLVLALDTDIFRGLERLAPNAAARARIRYLRDFEVSEIKVDGMFVAQLQRAQRDQSIVRSVAELAKGFGVKLVAEGIESEALWPMLRSLGCHVGQGFSIARPMSGTDVPSWSGHWSRRLETRKEFYRGVRRLRVNDLLNTTDIAPSYGSPN